MPKEMLLCLKISLDHCYYEKRGGILKLFTALYVRKKTDGG